jgi:hypothetical protein
MPTTKQIGDACEMLVAAAPGTVCRFWCRSLHYGNHQDLGMGVLLPFDPAQGAFRRDPPPPTQGRSSLSGSDEA